MRPARLTICVPGAEVAHRPAPAGVHPRDACSHAARGLPPFSSVSYLRDYGGRYGWVPVLAVETTPAPGWAAPGALWCRTCGAVSHDGPLTCIHAGAA